MITFSPHVESQLRLAGWSPDRRVDITSIVNTLASKGYTIFPAARLILENLNGLSINPLILPERVCKPTRVVIDPFRGDEFDVIQWWEDEFSLRLYPLGECFDTAILLVDDSGRLFSGSEWRFNAFGDDIADALERLLLGNRRWASWNMARYLELTYNVVGLSTTRPLDQNILNTMFDSQPRIVSYRIEWKTKENELLVHLKYEGIVPEHGQAKAMRDIQHGLEILSLNSKITRIRLQQLNAVD